MANTIQSYNIKDQYKGDTFNGVQFTLKNRADNTPIDLTDATIKTQFRKDTPLGDVQLEITDGNGITVVDAINGIFKFDAIEDLDWSVRTYVYDVQITFLSGLIRTYVKGAMRIIQDTTYG